MVGILGLRRSLTFLGSCGIMQAIPNQLFCKLQREDKMFTEREIQLLLEALEDSYQELRSWRDVKRKRGLDYLSENQELEELERLISKVDPLEVEI